jgi:hypothetical protein
MKNSFVFALVFVLSFTLQAQQKSEIQSAYIYHFTKYIEWPSTKQSGDFIIGILGDSPITAYLNVLASEKKAGTQKIVIKNFLSTSSITDCHILFISSKKSSELQTAIEKTLLFNTLVITEKEGNGKKGAGINFITIDGKSRFEINEKSINKGKIKVSAKLIQVGIKI